MSQYFLIKRYGRGPRFAHLANGELEPLCGAQVNLDLWEVKTLATGRPGRWCAKCIAINRQERQPGERHVDHAHQEIANEALATEIESVLEYGLAGRRGS